MIGEAVKSCRPCRESVSVSGGSQQRSQEHVYLGRSHPVELCVGGGGLDVYACAKFRSLFKQ